MIDVYFANVEPTVVFLCEFVQNGRDHFARSRTIPPKSATRIGLSAVSTSAWKFSWVRVTMFCEAIKQTQFYRPDFKPTSDPALATGYSPHIMNAVVPTAARPITAAAMARARCRSDSGPVCAPMARADRGAEAVATAALPAQQRWRASGA